MVFPQAMSLDALVASHPIEVKVRGNKRTLYKRNSVC